MGTNLRSSRAVIKAIWVKKRVILISMYVPKKEERRKEWGSETPGKKKKSKKKSSLFACVPLRRNSINLGTQLQ